MLPRVGLIGREEGLEAAGSKVEEEFGEGEAVGMGKLPQLRVGTRAQKGPAGPGVTVGTCSQ